MPKIVPEGLKGLKGLGSLSKPDYDAFVERNKDLISQHGYDPVYINNLYSNKQFIDKFGIDQFKAIPDINVRNGYYRDAIVEDEFNRLYKPREGYIGMGGNFNKYSQMSTDAKLKLLESDYLLPDEFEKNFKDTWQKDIKDVNEMIKNRGSLATNPTIPGTENSDYFTLDEDQEAVKRVARTKNDNILEHIYNDDVDTMAKKLGTEVNQTYENSDIVRLTDDQVKEAFVTAITPGSYEGNLGIAEYAAHYGDGSESALKQGDMDNFSIDDMRQVLAKKAVYDRYLGPEMAVTALNNEAKRYIKGQQSSMERFGMFLEDVGISALSYSADKVNGIYNLGLMATDALSDKPTVFVDDQGNILANNDQRIVKDGKGGLMYQAEDGQVHSVHQEQIDRTTLHNMGKNSDGTDDTSILNPQYWTRAEQFGTLDEAKQKQYEKLGSSPYKVAYDPNEESDLWYESFKMMSFGLADAASQVIPYGFGQFGKVLSTASKVGRVGRTFGKAMDYAGKALTAQTKFGQVAQGTAGALGIAYAYERGAFQETLAQNLANAEEATMNKGKQEIFNQYQNNEQYRSQVDALIETQAAEMKAEYMKQFAGENNGRILDEKAIDEMLKAKAQEIILGKLAQQRFQELKGSQDYANLQQEAINSAGEAANVAFLPEAIKYGMVNTMGFRKYLYSNPAGLQKKVSAALKGLKEVTTAEGKQRLATDASKFLTRADKWKQFGKILGSQAWGGAWTNGTDDMMVDAAERINEDSFNRYLHAYQTGEAMTDTYGFTDGLYSYWKGLNNSLGQGTTWNAAAVGGLGSIVSASPNMANIVHLATKEGREAFGKLNWREKAANLIQNGVLNTYYGAKQAERDLQNHADFVNKILDDYEDFKVIEDLVTSDIGTENAETAGEQKTMRFIKAINAMNALNHLGNNTHDPATLSSVVQQNKDLIERLSSGDMSQFSEEEANNLVAQYYASHPELAQNEYNSQKAMYDMMQNAQELQEASKAYDEAEKQVQKVERSLGKAIDPAVRAKMKMNQALDGHWRERVKKMQEEIDDHSDITGEVSMENMIPSVGGKKNAQALVKVYDKQLKELTQEYEKQHEETAKLEENLNEAKANLRQAQTSEEKLAAQQALDKAQSEVENSQQQEAYLSDLNVRTVEKKNKVIEALNAQAEEDSKVLTADEIMALDPITRARILRPENRQLYSKEQQREIEKLEQRLLMRDGDGLQKIQDIALLSQRIAQNQDAYSRMAKNPEAAAVQLESQRAQEAEAAYRLMNQRNAETVADFINEFDEGMKGHDDVNQASKDEFVFRTLRKLNPTLLNIINEDQLLPQYQTQVENAQEWGETLNDISAVVNQSEESEEWKANVSRNIDQIIDSAQSKGEIMARLEKVIDDTENTQAARDIDKILKGLENLGYQRDATVIETRKQRKERQEQESEKKEQQQAEAAKAQAEAEEWANAQPKQQVKADGSNLEAALEVAPIDQAEETAEQKGELSEPFDWSTVEEKGKEENTKEREKPVISNVEGHVVDNGESVRGQSATIDEQIAEGQQNQGKEVHSSDVTTDVSTLNGTGEQTIESSANTLSGNAMSMYESAPLKEDGILKQKKGTEPNDSRNRYNTWMESMGINLQNIIDNELGQILRRNPQAKVKFMAIRPQNNVTKDGDVKTHLFLVLDYDNSVNKGITSIHNDENGGVIESQGKKYLIIGTAGYGSKNLDKQALYDILFSNNPNKGNGYGLVKKGMGDFFRNNSEERFYIPEGLSTEIVPMSLIPGYIVNQLESDENRTFRGIGELLADKQRNPNGEDMQSLAWGIQERTKFLVVGTGLDKVMIPRNPERNAGNAFVLIPAANGKMVPSYLKPLFYNEMRDGELKTRVNALLDGITAPRYADRYQALMGLMNLFYFSKEGDNILLGKDGTGRKNQVSLIHGGNVLKTFVLDESFDRQAFMEAVVDMNPRINITASVLQSNVLLKQYDEAGALMTDIARLTTAGSSYSIYAVDAEGNMIKPDVVNNEVPKVGVNSDFRNAERMQVVYKHKYYRESDGTYYLNGIPVTDEATVRALDYNKRIIEGAISPIAAEGVWDTYILGSKENPEAVKVNRNTKEVQELTDKQAQDLLARIAKEEEDKKRGENAKQALEEIKAEDVNLEDEGFVVDEETGELISVSEAQRKEAELEKKEKKEEEVPAQQQGQNQDSFTHRSVESLEASENKAGTQKFSDLIKDRKYMMPVYQIIKNKWPEAPSKIEDLTQFLKQKGVDVDMIGTSDVDVQAWLKTLRDCR